jgi:NADH:ubiquinone reductase (H+-translocating)
VLILAVVLAGAAVIAVRIPEAVHWSWHDLLVFLCVMQAIDALCAAGDRAAAKDKDGKPVPGIAPAAKQMGRYVARAIRARMADTRPEPFRYADFGNLATIGRSAAVADFGRVRLAGFPAWLVWSSAHLWFLVGFRNRIAVFLDWIWAYATFDRSARLITGRQER